MHINKQSVFIGKLLLVFLTFFLIILSVRQTRGQVTNSFSPTPTLPASSSIPTIPLINSETLADPAAFKLDQQIKQTTRDLFKTLTSGGQPSVMENQAVQRKNLMKQAISKYPYVFLGNALTSSETGRFDLNVQAYLEKPQALSNVELEVLHTDDFENQKSQEDFYLQNIKEQQRFTFYPSGEFTGHISGTTLNVNGVALDNEVSARVLAAPQAGGGENNNDPVPTNVEILKEAVPDALGPQRVAIILVKPKGATFQPYYSKEQIEEMILRGEVNQFFKEASYGKMWLDEEKSKIYGWYEVEGLDEDVLFNNKRFYEFITTVVQTTDPDINFNDFDRVIVEAAIDNNTVGGRGNVGKRTYSTADGNIYFSFSVSGIGKNLVGTTTHELGHNLGVSHASSWVCDKGPLDENCEHIEYGNIYDVMGKSSNMRHFNAYFKEVFQWLSPQNQTVLDIDINDINKSGIYTLKPLEMKDAVVGRIRLLNASNFPRYYLEYREPLGFDAKQRARNIPYGVHINWQYERLSTRILNMSLDRNPNRDILISPLEQGQIFTDEKAGLSITNMGIDRMKLEAAIKVELKESECKDDNLETKIEDIYAYEVGDENGPGWTPQAEMTCNQVECVLKRKSQNDLLLTFYLTVKNNNFYSCADRRIQALLDDPWKKDVAYSQVEWLITSGNIGYLTPSAIIPTDVPADTYSISVKLENKENSRIFFSTSRNLEIVDESPPLEGDLNNDQKVDIFDLVLVARDFGKKAADLPSDIDKDGDVDIFDLVIVAKNFGKKAE